MEIKRDLIRLGVEFEFELAMPGEHNLRNAMAATACALSAGVPADAIARGLSDADYQRMAASSLLHEKPLSNALGDAFRDILTTPKLTTLFQLM